jgi:hypothetical protein
MTRGLFTTTSAGLQHPCKKIMALKSHNVYLLFGAKGFQHTCSLAPWEPSRVSDQARIAALSLNPAIDQTALVPNFTAGSVNRVGRDQSATGGKGVTIPCPFGLPVAVTGLLVDTNAERFVHLFARKGIDDRFVRVSGRTRVNVKVVDEIQVRVTHLNFPGLAPRPADLTPSLMTV